MSRDFRVYLDDMLDAVQKIKMYLRTTTREEFLQDSMRIDAVIRNLGIIGEAAKNIPVEVRTKYPQVKWQQVVDFRNVVIHEYFRVTLDVVWSITQDDLSDLETQIGEI